MQLIRQATFRYATAPISPSITSTIFQYQLTFKVSTVDPLHHYPEDAVIQKTGVQFYDIRTLQTFQQSNLFNTSTKKQRNRGRHTHTYTRKKVAAAPQNRAKSEVSSSSGEGSARGRGGVYVYIYWKKKKRARAAKKKTITGERI